jgi:hypothetical protein|tara:strand:- start:75 stop:215 length:141 start_codon:yes stop_codon:yes gene_type:complete
VLQRIEVSSLLPLVSSLGTPFSLLDVLALKAMRDSTDGKTGMAGGK